MKQRDAYDRLIVALPDCVRKWQRNESDDRDDQLHFDFAITANPILLACGLAPVSKDDCAAADRSAQGHSDYMHKVALRIAEIGTDKAVPA